MLVNRPQFPIAISKILQRVNQCVHEWTFNSMKLSLIRNYNHLEYVLINDYGKEIKGMIDCLPDAYVNERIRFITEKCVPIITNEEVSFIPFIRKWEIDIGEVFLLESNNSLIYVFHDLHGKRIQGPVSVPEDRNLNECIEYLVSCEPEVTNGTVSFAPSSILVHQWRVKDRIVYLFKSSIGIDCKIVNNENGASSRIPIPFENSAEINREDAIEYLKGCEPIIIDNKIDFFPVYHKWTWKNYKIQLLENSSNTFFPNNLLIWQVFNEKTQKSTFLPLSHARLCYEQETIEVKDIDYLKKCKIAKLEQASQLLCFEPIVYRSKFDNETILTSDLCAVTLINTSTAANDPKTWYGHAGIMIEGINEGAYFSCFTDLIAKDGGCVRLLSGERIRCYGKTKTCLVKRAKVEMMIERIKEEIALQEKGEPIVSFHLSGGITSWTTWLEIFVNMFRYGEESFYHKIFDSYEDMVKNMLGCNPRTFDSVIWDLDQNNDLEVILKKQKIESEISKLLNEEKIEEMAPKNKQTILRRLRIKLNEDDGWWEDSSPHILENTPPLALVIKLPCGQFKDKWAVCKSHENCISWTSEKLLSLGIQLNEPVGTMHPFIQKPSNYFHQSGVVNLNLIGDLVYESKSLNPPLEIQKKALELDEKYLNELKSAFEQSQLIPPRPQKTITSLLSGEVDAYTFLWLASLLNMPGITKEIREFLMINKDTSPMRSALRMACSLGRLKEVSSFLEYQYVNLEAIEEENEKLIDIVLTKIKNENMAYTMFFVLMSYDTINKGFFQTQFYKNEDFRNAVYADFDKNGFVNFKGILELYYLHFQTKESEILKEQERSCVIS